MILEQLVSDTTARFWAQVDKTDGCWEWLGGKTPDGYGKFSVNRRTVSAHRFAYENIVGEIEAETLDHLCSNRGCVYPTHMEPVTVAENNRRGNTKTHCKRGHALAGDNIYVDTSTGRRQCLICRRASWRRHNRRRQLLTSPRLAHN